ncbi:MAG: hypothetical protein QXG02_00960 [Candidatus Anstonellales archaeon]
MKSLEEKIENGVRVARLNKELNDAMKFIRNVTRMEFIKEPVVDTSRDVGKKVSKEHFAEIKKMWFMFLLLNPQKIRNHPSYHIATADPPVIWIGKQADFSERKNYYKSVKYLMAHELMHILDFQNQLYYDGTITRMCLMEGRAAFIGWLYSLGNFEMAKGMAGDYFGEWMSKNITIAKIFFRGDIELVAKLMAKYNPYIPGYHFIAEMVERFGIDEAFKITRTKPPYNFMEILCPEQYLCNMALIEAIKEKDVETVEKLLGFGADPNAVATDLPGKPSAIALAIETNQCEVVKLLNEYGASIKSGE